MDPYATMNQRSLRACQDRMWQTIVDYRFLTGAKLTHDDHFVRLAATAEANRQLGATQPRRARLVLAELRHRLGTALVAVGRRLQPAPLTTPRQPDAAPSLM